MLEFIDQLAFESSIAVVSAFFIGLATSIAPCTFATNVAAISYLSHYADNPGRSLRAAISFMAGRMTTYVILGLFMIWAGRVVGSVARNTQTYGNIVMGPVLILIGLAFCGVFSLNTSVGGGYISKVMPSLSQKGMVGSYLLGALFAIAFCPYSGMLFFGMLIPLALKTSYGVLLPALFGIGVSVPVITFAVLLYYSATRARAFGRFISSSWAYVGKTMGLVIIIIGSYYIAPYLEERFGVSYAFELLSLLFCSIALFRMIPPEHTPSERHDTEYTPSRVPEQERSSLSARTAQSMPASVPATEKRKNVAKRPQGIPRRED